MRVPARDVIADAIVYSRIAPMRDSAGRVAEEVITQLEGSGWRIVPAGMVGAIEDLLDRQHDYPTDLSRDPEWSRAFDQVRAALGRVREPAE